MDQDTAIVSPGEFLAVRHSVLNGNTYDVGKLVEDTLKLEQHLNGRRAVPCFEGDILQVAETGEIVLTHQNFSSLSKVKYQALREQKIAASLLEVLDKIAAYKQKNPDQKVVLCFEPKYITDKKTIDEAVLALKEYGIQDAYFDSFFGGKLDLVQQANLKYGTNYPRSLHLIGNVGKRQLIMTPAEQGHDVLTVPHAMSFGKVKEPVIYGAVGSTEILERIAEDPQTVGAYIRLKEGAGVKGALLKLWNSVTNTQELRKTTVSLYFP